MPDYQHTRVDGVAVVHRSDPKNSISGWLGLTRFQGMLAAVVEWPSAKHQVTALLDLVDLHLAKQGASDEGVALLIHQPHPEAASALEVLRDAVKARVPVHLLRYEQREWTPMPASDFDVTAAHLHYPRWPGLLGADFAVPALVLELVAATGLPEVRAYPQLTAKGEWSIRVEGLQVGRVLRDGTGWLDVGRPLTLHDAGPERRAWLQVSPDRFPFNVDTFMGAADKVREFAQQWRNTQSGAQNEHVLESRILRGDVDVVVDDRPLQLIQPDDSIVNWGSQFPTKWGPSGKARYLDALLRDPIDTGVPWAVEMKVRLGEGQYYRHAVAQAVLYRHFIREAKDLHFWFDHYSLDAALCRAAVVVPEFKSSTWQTRLSTLCETFGVSFATVPEAATLR